MWKILRAMVLAEKNANAANRMLQISKIFDVVNSWPTTKDYSQKQKNKDCYQNGEQTYNLLKKSATGS